MKQLLLATNNQGKVAEFKRLLAGIKVECITPDAIGLHLDVEETGTTYAENASIKALAFARASDLACLADDSGIEVDALDGRPGLYSARYGGKTLDAMGRNRLLLEELKDIPASRRTARFRAVIAIADPHSPDVRCFEGVQEGTIGQDSRGSAGFGYDPLFLVDGKRTQAEISTAEKDAISHRGQACRLACEYIKAQL